MTASRLSDTSTQAAWRKSSHSGSENAHCVEVADGYPAMVPVRDSKDPHGPVLVFPASSWSSFVMTVKGSGLATRLN